MDQKSVFSREFVKAFCQLEEQMKDGKQVLHEEGTIPYTKDCSTWTQEDSGVASVHPYHSRTIVDQTK